MKIKQEVTFVNGGYIVDTIIFNQVVRWYIGIDGIEVLCYGIQSPQKPYVIPSGGFFKQVNPKYLVKI